MNELYIMRHGETEWNHQKRYQGQMDSALTETGRSGTLLQKEKLKDLNFERVFCSPLGRTRETLNLLAPRSQGLVYDDRLKEICLGLLQGKTHTELADHERLAQEKFWTDPESFSIDGAETMAELETRVKDFLLDLQNIEGRILVITHTVIIKMVLKILDSKPISRLWDDPFLHPGTILIVDKNHQPCIREVINPQENMEPSASYTA